jgi:uncharacterized protein HemX
MAQAKKGNMAKKVGAGIIAASAVAAAGYYFYGSKDAKKHRGDATKWAKDMKDEILQETEKLKKLKPEDFAKVVDVVAGTYAQSKQTLKEVKKAVKKTKKATR